jgi:pimeloyl-ACP methyl ester carboxylesterase
MGSPREGFVEADGMRFPYAEAGHGSPVVHLQPPGVPRFTPAHELLSRRFRVVLVASAPPGDATSDAVIAALTALGLDTFTLVGGGAATALTVRMAGRAPTRVLALALESPRAVPPDLDGLERLDVPTLVLIGTRDGDAAERRAVAERLPHAHLVFVYDAGPAISADRPEAFVEVVGDFLERRDAFVISRAPTVIHP